MSNIPEDIYLALNTKRDKKTNKGLLGIGIPNFAISLIEFLKDKIKAANGIILDDLTLKLGGELTEDTVIEQNSNTFSLVNDYSSFIKGETPLSTEGVMFIKEVNPLEYSMIGMFDGSGFGIDSDSIILGRLNLNTFENTFVQIDPSSGTIDIQSQDELFIQSKNSWAGGVNNGLNVAGNYLGNFSITPYDTLPAITLELQKEQEYAIGFAAIDSPTKKYSNIYYGLLDANNLIYDISRVEVTEAGTSSLFTYEHVNDYYNEIITNIDGIEFKNTEFNSFLKFSNNGNLELSEYENTRDDSATTAPINLLYTDVQGNVLVAPIEKVVYDLPVYVDDAAADVDTNLLSGMFYKVTGSRAVYSKP